jgi:hypothetical protein
MSTLCINVNGNILTEDFPKDHLHHRGVFWAWHQVLIGDKKMGDAWECRDFIWDVQQFDQGQSDLNSMTLNRPHAVEVAIVEG